MRRALVGLMIVVMLAGAVPVSAQGGDDDCTTEDLTAWYTGVQPWFNVLSTAANLDDEMELGEDGADYSMRRALFEIDRLERPVCADPVVADLYRKMNALMVMLYCLFRDQECSDAASAMLKAEPTYDLPDLTDLIEQDDTILPDGWDWEAVKAMFPDEEAEVATDTIGTRTNPILLGSPVQAPNYGTVRLIGIIDPVVTTADTYGPDDGYRLVGFQIEYECQLADPNETCSGSDLYLDGVVTPDGRVLDIEYAVVHDGSEFGEAEGFPGTTLTGVAYGSIPETETFTQIRIDISSWNWDNLYFNVE